MTQDFAKDTICEAVRQNVKQTEPHYLSWTDDIGKELTTLITDNLIKSLDRHGENVVQWCIYSGVPLSATPGPFSKSVESYYMMTLFDGSPRYHAPPNVGMVATTLNWAKRQHGPLALPLSCEFTRVSRDKKLPFQVREQKLTWIYNAQCNAAALSASYPLFSNHEIRAASYGEMTEAELTELLESVRTGIARPERVPSYRSLFPPYRRQVIAKHQMLETPTEFHNTCLRIALSYNISQRDFEHFFTVQAPIKGDPRVFYPFHPLSHVQAEEYEWDILSTVKFFDDRLSRMRDKCNRHFETEHGEKDLNAVRLTYWMVHHVCRQLADIRYFFTDPEELCFYLLLDRWSLPIIPCTNHQFGFSLCRKQDHGMAMKTGITIPEGEIFDPVNHFDHSQCTVTVDTQLTNVAMKSYTPEWWWSIRTLCTLVPIHHWLWRPADTLGDRIWGLEAQLTIIPQPPAPDFSPPLIPISNWVHVKRIDQVSVPLCHICPNNNITYNSLGALLHHYRLTHSGENTVLENVPILQRLINFSSSEPVSFACPECERTFTQKETLTKHMHIHLPVEERLSFHCPKCEKTFTRKSHLTSHIQIHLPSEERPRLPCPKCERTFLSKLGLTTHIKSHLPPGEERPLPGEERPCFPCPECGDTFTQKEHLTRHMKIQLLPEIPN